MPDETYRHYVIALNDNVTPNTQSAPIHREHFKKHVVQVINTNGASVQILGSLQDTPTNWALLTPEFTDTNKIFIWDGPVRWLSVKRDNTNKPVTAIVASF